MDPIAAAAGIAGLIGTVVAILVGLSNLVSFSQGQAEKRRAKRQKQQQAAIDSSPPADAPPAAALQGAVATTGDYDRAQQIYEDAAALWRTLDDEGAWRGCILCLMGGNAQCREEYAQAAVLWQEGLDLLRRSADGNTEGKTGGEMEIAWALYGVAGATLRQGDADKAAATACRELSASACGRGHGRSGLDARQRRAGGTGAGEARPGACLCAGRCPASSGDGQPPGYCRGPVVLGALRWPNSA